MVEPRKGQPTSKAHEAQDPSWCSKDQFYTSRGPIVRAAITDSTDAGPNGCHGPSIAEARVSPLDLPKHEIPRDPKKGKHKWTTTPRNDQLTSQWRSWSYTVMTNLNRIWVSNLNYPSVFQGGRWSGLWPIFEMTRARENTPRGFCRQPEAINVIRRAQEIWLVSSMAIWRSTFRSGHSWRANSSKIVVCRPLTSTMAQQTRLTTHRLLSPSWTSTRIRTRWSAESSPSPYKDRLESGSGSWRPIPSLPGNSYRRYS